MIIKTKRKPYKKEVCKRHTYTRQKLTCPICGKQIARGSCFTRHLNSHNSIHKRTITHIFDYTHGLICSYCGKQLKNKHALVSHELRCSKNPLKIDTLGQYDKVGHTAWSKGLSKESSSILKKRGEKLSAKYKNNELISFWKNKHMSQTCKNKISEKLKEAISNNPNNFYYVKCHSSKPNYVENYFIEVFNKENINVNYHYMVGRYQLDFCNIKYKKYIEIDGEQHYTDKRIVKHDIERTKNLALLGWEGYRVRWSEYKQMTYQDKKSIIDKIRNFLIS
jgi:very-short-patch-repair endonuclease